VRSACLWCRYRDKKVVGVFVRFSCAASDISAGMLEVGVKKIADKISKNKMVLGDSKICHSMIIILMRLQSLWSKKL
jgi:hypothetical protein